MQELSRRVRYARAGMDQGGLTVSAKTARDYVAIDVACPFCLVAVDVYCIDRGGYRALKGKRSHQSRIGLAADIAKAARSKR